MPHEAFDQLPSKRQALRGHRCRTEKVVVTERTVKPQLQKREPPAMGGFSRQHQAAMNNNKEGVTILNLHRS